jgi:hypothetical protein
MACAIIFLATLPLNVWAADGAKANFTLSTKSEIPGQTLQPGSYTIQIVGRLADRVILKVEDTTGKAYVDFIGVRSPETQKPSASGVIDWSTPVENATYIRGWVPPGSSSVVEFVYPKDQAVAIAKVNQAKVPAIDPASEGRKVDPTLSREDMQLVTLWLLSSTRVGPEAPADIKAERFQMASTAGHAPVIARLPHTASALPLVLILSLFSIAIAGLIRQRRLGI